MKTTRLLFWGTSDFAVPALQALAAMPSITICGVVTQPDRPAGRHQEPEVSPVKRAADTLGLTVLQPEKLDAAAKETLSALQPAVAVVVAYGRIIPDSFLHIPKHNTLNLHPSLLPLYRGPSPIQSVIRDGQTETGVTLMLLDKEMDHGPILAKTTHQLHGTETATELTTTLADIGAQLLVQHLPAYLSGNITPAEQDHAKATVCKMISREDGKIDWSRSAVDIERMSRAYEPWPGIWTEWVLGVERLRVKLFEVQVQQETQSPGSLQIENGLLFIGTGAGTLSVGAAQVEGKKRLTISELLRGMPHFEKGRFV